MSERILTCLTCGVCLSTSAEDETLRACPKCGGSRFNPGSGPPYDGKPCPACSLEARGLSATAHNLCWRFLDGGHWNKVPDKMRSLTLAVEGGRRQPETFSARPDLAELLAAAEEVAMVWADNLEFFYGPTGIELYDNARARVGSAVRRLDAAQKAVAPLMDAHFVNKEHSHGELQRQPIAF